VEVGCGIEFKEPHILVKTWMKGECFMTIGKNVFHFRIPPEQLKVELGRPNIHCFSLRNREEEVILTRRNLPELWGFLLWLEGILEGKFTQGQGELSDHPEWEISLHVSPLSRFGRTTWPSNLKMPCSEIYVVRIRGEWNYLSPFRRLVEGLMIEIGRRG
jgi:hypothetical protein